MLGALKAMSDSETAIWPAVVAAASGLIGAAMGAFATYKVNNRTLTAQFASEQQRINQQRIESAYLTLQIYITKWADVARWKQAKFHMSGELEPLMPRISGEEEAYAALFTSEATVESIRIFNLRREKFRVDVGTMEDIEEQVKSGGNSPALLNERVRAYDELNESAQELIDAAESTHKLLRTELGVK